MRFLAVLALLAALGPLPGVPTLPEGSTVQVLRASLQSVLTSGEVRDRKLSLAPLPASETVRVWIGTPDTRGSGTLQAFEAFSGIISLDGQDIRLIASREGPLGGRDGLSFRQVLRDAYRVTLVIERP